MTKAKIAVYIDGFNYYYAILDYMRNNIGRKSLKWLDYRYFIETKLLKNISYDKTNLKINFYTAINGYRSKSSQQKHNTYLNALKTRNINIIKGFYKLRDVRLNCHVECSNCNNTVIINNYKINQINNLTCDKCNFFIDISQKEVIKHPEEKQTDTNISKDILIDALKEKDNFDVFYLFSTDSDFVPVVDYVINECNKKFVIVAPDNKITKHIKKKDGSCLTTTNFRYEINKFNDIGAEEYRIKMGRLSNYQLPDKIGTIVKPQSW